MHVYQINMSNISGITNPGNVVPKAENTETKS